MVDTLVQVWYVSGKQGEYMKIIPESVRLQIRTDREAGMGLDALVVKYKYPRSTTYYNIRDCNSSKVERNVRGKRVVGNVIPKDRPSLSKTDLGEAARQMICARLMLNGVKVFRPMTEDTPTDLLVLQKSGSVLKCQCKYVFPDKRGAHVLKCCSAGRGEERNHRKHVYTEDEVDYLLGYCLDDDAVYVVPLNVTHGQSQVSLWILRRVCGGNGIKSFDGETYKNAYDLLK